jgi:hypothetical protein
MENASRFELSWDGLIHEAMANRTAARCTARNFEGTCARPAEKKQNRPEAELEAV